MNLASLLLLAALGLGPEPLPLPPPPTTKVNLANQVQGLLNCANAGTYCPLVDTGAANAYVISPSPAPTSYVTGQTWIFQAVNANTGASTLNVSSLGAKNITKQGATALASGDIKANQILIVTYDGTEFQMLGGVQPAAVQTRRTCAMVFGADNDAVALVNADIAPQGRQCFIPYAATVIEVTVSADAGTPNVVVAKNHAGTVTDLTSSALATAASGGIACSNTGGTTGLDGATTCSGTLTTTALAIGDYLQTDTATAGGTAKRMSVFVTFTVN